jgi:hypothetical protein
MTVFTGLQVRHYDENVEHLMDVRLKKPRLRQDVSCQLAM